MVDQRDHAVVVRDQVPQLLVALHRRARSFLPELAQGFVGHLRPPLERGAMPPRPALEVERAVRRQVDLVRMMQIAPRFGRVERMVRIGKRRPRAERPVAMLAQVVDRAVADPRRIVEGDRQRGVPRLRGVGQRRQRRVIELGQRFAAVLVIPALVMLPARRSHRRKAIVALDHELDVPDAHVRPVPVRAVVRSARAAFGRAGRRERVRRREMRLADQRRRVALLRKASWRNRAPRSAAAGRCRCRRRRACAGGARSGSTSATAGTRGSA